MLELSDSVQPIHPAATVVLLRDTADGLEALLVQRSQAVNHMGGIWVFPGGKIEEADYSADREDYSAALQAAIRETEEEAGLKLDASRLAYLSHWTTPEGAKRRFSTWFFLAALEDDQQVEVDGGEIAQHRWVSPKQALSEIADPDHALKLMPPTFVSLVDIADCASCADALDYARAREAVQYAPRMVFLDNGICFLYAGDAGYDDVNMDAKGSRHRTYMIDDRLDYQRHD
ncbi:MAG: NUDIX hydrolase [Pseudomonadota bacterium]